MCSHMVSAVPGARLALVGEHAGVHAAGRDLHHAQAGHAGRRLHHVARAPVHAALPVLVAAPGVHQAACSKQASPRMCQ